MKKYFFYFLVFLLILSVGFSVGSTNLGKRSNYMFNFGQYVGVSTADSIYLLRPSSLTFAFSITGLNISGNPVVRGSELLVPTTEGVAILNQDLKQRAFVILNNTLGVYAPSGDHFYVMTNQRLHKFFLDPVRLTFSEAGNATYSGIRTRSVLFLELDNALYLLLDDSVLIFNMENLELLRMYNASSHYASSENFVEFFGKAYFGDSYGNVYSVDQLSIGREFYVEHMVLSLASEFSRLYIGTSSGEIFMYDRLNLRNYKLGDGYVDRIHRIGQRIVAVGRKSVYVLDSDLNAYVEKSFSSNVLDSSATTSNFISSHSNGEMHSFSSSELFRGCYIEYPTENLLSGYISFEAKGYGSDVEVRLNNGAWVRPNFSTNQWTYTINPNKLAFGEVLFECRASGDAEYPSSVLFLRNESAPFGEFFVELPDQVEGGEQITIEVKDQFGKPVKDYLLTVNGEQKEIREKTSLTFESGTYYLLFQKEGFNDYSKNVEVSGFPTMLVIGILAVLGVIFFLVNKFVLSKMRKPDKKEEDL